MQQAGLVSRIERIGGDADAGSDADIEGVVLQPFRFFNQAMQTARDAACVLFGSLRKQKNKFIAAVTESEIDQAAIALDHGADFAEELRAHQVAMGVVDGLEVIE